MQDKDAIIKQLTEENKQLREHIKLLEERIARLERNSSNSSKPPSSDIINPNPANKKRRNANVAVNLVTQSTVVSHLLTSK
ncbi:MAG: DUF6444 domain-containing protein [Planctomycetota bacterium]|jgi:cell division septum initiation protein DivIVA